MKNRITITYVPIFRFLSVLNSTYSSTGTRFRLIRYPSCTAVILVYNPNDKLRVRRICTSIRSQIFATIKLLIVLIVVPVLANRHTCRRGRCTGGKLQRNIDNQFLTRRSPHVPVRACTGASQRAFEARRHRYREPATLLGWVVASVVG